MNNLLLKLRNSPIKINYLTITKRYLSDKRNQILKEPCVIMCADSQHILCHHPEPEHPYIFTKDIPRKEENEMILKTDLANLYYNRFDNIPAKNSRDHWIDALRLSKTFNEHPITFKRSNRDERVKKFLEKTQPILKNRDSI